MVPDERCVVMGCIYEDQMEGTCTMFDEKNPDLRPQGCDKKGECCTSEDPDPNVGCDFYESDWTCFDCGVDLNIDECECEDEADQ